MHTDRKIGFAMGILLIGIVAALFFRNEPLLNPDVPTVRREQELNDRLRERNVAVYLTDDDASASDASKEQDRQRWTLKEVLDNMGTRNKSRPSPVGAEPDDDQADPSDSSAGSASDLVTPIPSGGARITQSDDVPVPVDSQEPADGSSDHAVPVVAINGEPVAESKEKLTDQDSFQPPADFEEYVVKYGDTLSGIAQKFLGSQSRYLEIYDANRDRMSSPDRLDVGKPLRIPRVATNADPSGTH